MTYPTTPQGWASLDWDRLCATPASTANWNQQGTSQAQVHLAELARQITKASTDHTLAAELALSCPLQSTQGSRVFQAEATAHAQLALAAAMQESGGMSNVMCEQTKAVRAQTKALRRKTRGEFT